jgi:tetratricopeptide (TPR) repeat protein
VEECKAYTRAVSTEEKKNWQEAYDAYQAYLDTYPNGLYVTESHEHSATALLNIAKTQTEAGRHQEAISSLDLVLSSYSDTDAYADALTLIPSTYQTWEADLREIGDFENAIQVLNTFKTWSQNNQNSDAALKAQSELAETYLEWGMSFQS